MGQKDRRQQLYGRITCDFTQTLQWHACSFTNVGYTLARTRQERSAAKYICGSIRKVKKMKKYLCASIATIMIAAALAGCGSSGDNAAAAPSTTAPAASTPEAIIANKTDVMMTNVAGDPYAIGYISLGSLNDTVKALKIDGAEATAENVKAGTYKVSRPFNVATKGDASEAAQDFMSFIMSAEGQQVIEDNGYIKVDDAAAAFAGTKPEGKIVVAGSSSVSPVMEKLKEAYTAINPNATIEIQTSDSTAGMTAAMDGTCDIGMASRALSEDEAAALNATVIASDGIAVVVAPGNPLDELTSGQVKSVFTGETLAWDALLQ